MSNLKTPRLRSQRYRESARHRHCMVRHPDTGDFCNGEGVVLCHIRLAGNAGMGLKPDDGDSLFLCSRCHAEMDGRADGWPSSTALWIVRNIVIPERRAAFRKYESERGA